MFNYSIDILECLLPAEKTWFLKYYQQLAQMGILIMRKESKHHIPFVSPVQKHKIECILYYNIHFTFKIRI